jgi:hypothetical protein
MASVRGWRELDYGEVFTAWHLEAPRPELSEEHLGLDFRGWILGRTTPPYNVTVRHGEVVYLNLPVGVPRPDVAASFSAAPGAQTSGFNGSLNLLGLPLDCTLEVAAGVDGAQMPILELEVTRPAIATLPRPRFRPLLVTTLGRSGSTLLMELLATHPAIGIHPTANYETRAITFWAYQLGSLAHPDGVPYGAEAFGHFHLADSAKERAWMTSEYARRAATFCDASLQTYYEANLPRGANVSYVAEKSHPDRIPWIVWEMYPNDTKEVILVRDPRDIYCSIREFNRKRGYPAFRRAEVASEDEYIRLLGHDAQGLYSSWVRRSWRSHVIRYEDLVSNPATTLGGLLEYLDLSEDKKALRRMTRLAERRDAPTEHMTSDSIEMSVGRWRRELDDATLELCDSVFGPMLEGFGYQTSSGLA